ncbi:MAG TPA: glycosyltransferase family 87 protein [Candidatus Sulfotelmatobacter sp.]|jgi:hypothetical protein
MPVPASYTSSPAARIILWILIFLAAAEFAVRGPIRYLHQRSNWNDLSQNYTASRLWLQGKSPADPENFVALWKQEGHSRLDLSDIRTHLAPPPGGLVVLAPVAALPWRVARISWMVLLLISVAATVGSLMRTAGVAWNDSRALAFVAACLALAPFQTGLASGNTSILVIGLCAMAIWAARDRRDILAALLFGIACAVKPQLGAFFVLYYLLRRRWSLFSTAVATTLALNFVAILYLQLRGASWLQGYLQNARGFVTANHIDDFTTQNPARFTLINLQVPFFSMMANTSWANWLAFAVTAVLVCAWAYWTVKNRERAPELLCLGAISAIALLPVYHRFYDAAMLAVPLAWCMLNRFDKARARLTLLLMAPFLIPGAALLQQLAANGRLPASIAGSWWWNCLVMPHETWMILAIALVLMYAIKRSSSVAAAAV